MQSVSSLLLEKTPKYSVTIPSTGKETRFRPFFVKEEKILLIAQNTSSKNDIMFAINDIIEACVEGVENANNIPLFDVEYLFIKLRSKSVGETVEPIIQCPYTGERVELEVNLDEISLVESPDHKKTFKINDDIIVHMRYPSIAILSHINEGMDINDPEKFYQMVVHCISAIETREAKQTAEEIGIDELQKFVDSMTKKQFEMLLSFFSTAPKLEYVAEYMTKDGSTHSITLSGLGDFFG